MVRKRRNKRRKRRGKRWIGIGGKVVEVGIIFQCSEMAPVYATYFLFCLFFHVVFLLRSVRRLFSRLTLPLSCLPVSVSCILVSYIVFISDSVCSCLRVVPVPLKCLFFFPGVSFLSPKSFIHWLVLVSCILFTPSCLSFSFLSFLSCFLQFYCFWSSLYFSFICSLSLISPSLLFSLCFPVMNAVASVLGFLFHPFQYFFPYCSCPFLFFLFLSLCVCISPFLLSL